MTEMLLDGEVKDDEAALEYMETIYTEGQRLASMVEELLDIAKIESGRLEFKRETFPVPSVIENCVSTLSAQAAAKGISVRWEAPSRLPPLHADKGKFHQVVFNLLNNALCYSDAGASVRIRARAENGALSLSFEDTGWGIPEQDLPHIFTKFYRSKVHAPRVKGTGLGLPLVQEIIKAHGGSIEVASTPGSGSTFTVLMPFGGA
jgi:two-component system phosphate regulon sensor histidine kinase PhoR